MKKLTQIIGLISLAVLLLSIPAGCKSTLEPGGAYAPIGQAPDKAFYGVDATFDLAEGIVDGALKFERDNRLLLWRLSPDIKHSLDKLRPEFVNIVKQWGTARKAYMANPTPAGLSTLQTILGQMQQVSQAIQAVIPK